MKLLKGTIMWAILVGIISGCGSLNRTEEETKLNDIQFAINVGLKPEEGFEDWIQEYNKQTEISLDFKYTNTNEYYSDLEVGFASEDIPDVFVVSSDKLAMYALDGNLHDLTELVQNSTCINNIDPKLIDAIKVDEKIYGVPLERGGGVVTYIRQDWLEKLGLNQPTNYTEFIQVLRAFKTLGEDVIPFTAPGFIVEHGEYYLGQFYQDANPNLIQDSNEKWIDGMLQPNMVPALERLKSAYAEGLIDSQIITNKTSTCRNKWYAGNVGVFNYWAGNWAVTLEDRLKRNVNEAKVEVIKPINESHYIERLPNVMSISSTCENPEMVFKNIIEYAADGKKGSMLFQHGVENTHYTIEDNGIVKANYKANKPDEVFEKAFISPVLTTTPIQLEGYRFDVDERVKHSLEILYNNCIQDTPIPSSEALLKINTHLLELKEEIIVDIVLGEVSVQEGLEQYKIQSEELGVSKILKELN